MSITSVMLAFLAPMVRAKPDDQGERLRELEIENKALRDRLNDLSRINDALVRCENGQIAGLQAQLKTAAQRIDDYRVRLRQVEAMHEGRRNMDMPQQVDMPQQLPYRGPSPAMVDFMRAAQQQGHREWPPAMLDAAMIQELRALQAFCTCTPSRSEVLRTYPHAIRREDSLGLGLGPLLD